jgi:Family of unknown function (DUF6288)
MLLAEYITATGDESVLPGLRWLALEAANGQSAVGSWRHKFALPDGRLMRFYIGKGAVPYGDHPAWTETHEDNGKCGMAAVLFQRLGEAKGVEFFTRMAVASHGNERDGGHTGNYFNMTWSLPAIGQAGPKATGAWMAKFGAWYHDLARRWDGTFAHQGPPEPDIDSYKGWDATGAYLPPPALGKLAELDPAIVVTPPQGMEVGYVPIVTRQAAKN